MSNNVKIIFTYFKNKYEILSEEKDIINELSNYARKFSKKLEEFEYYYKGKKIKIDNNFPLKKLNNSNINILIINLKLKNEITPPPNQILCPNCNNLALFKLKGDKILINNCMKRHSIPILEITNFIRHQSKKDKKVICEECSNEKIFYNNEFFKCSCKKKICSLCIRKHSNHQYIYFYGSFMICYKHCSHYTTYCKECFQNLCPKCEAQHVGHKMENIKKNKPNKKFIDSVKNEIKEAKLKIEEYKKYLEKLKKTLYSKIDYLINYILDYNELLKKISFSIENLYNFENLQTLLNFGSFKILDFVKKIKKKIQKCLKIQIDLFDNDNKMEMTYIKKDEPKITLLGENFTKINKNNYVIVINDEIQDNNHYYKIDPSKESEIKVELFGNNKITNMASMFDNCKELTSVDMTGWDMSNVTNIGQIFKTCLSLESITCKSDLNTQNVTDMSNIFFECNNLKSLPDISKWNTKKVTNMRNMFKGCNMLTSLPNISKWDTRNVTDMSSMFSGCKLLINLPDISGWNTSKVIDMNNLFRDCKSLEILPDISNWNTSKVKDMKFMFSDCNSLKFLPDISKWDTSSVLSFTQIFNNCRLLKKIPNIDKKWTILPKCDVSHMFIGCTGLESDYNQIFENKKRASLNSFEIIDSSIKDYII